MAEMAAHPEDNELLKWMAGELDEATTDRIDQHIAACDGCAQRLGTLDQAPDQFVERLRGNQEQPESPGMPDDRNLLFGVLALQVDLIDERQFVDASSLLASRKSDVTMADILVEHGWLQGEDTSQVDGLLDRKLKKRAEGVVVKPRPTEQHADSSGTLGGGTVILGALEEGHIQRKELHSTGGIGQVWLAHDGILGRDIALKELLSEKAGSAKNRARFFREAQLTGQLEHPGIVPVYNFYRESDGERAYYTMRFIRGRTMTTVIEQYHEKKKEGLALVEMMTLLSGFVTICNALSYAHSREVIHRDLKGDNIIFGDFGEVIVLDWGLAKKMNKDDDSVDEPRHSAATMQGERLGTPAYMAPEQALGQVNLVDYRTDIYGMAAILYEILTGRPPFVADDVLQVLRQVERDAPTPPTKIDATISPELEKICLQGLAKKRDDRQQSAAEIGSQVQDWIAQQAERKRTEQERERFFALSLDLLAIVNTAGAFTQSNPAWETTLGRSTANLAEQTFFEVVHEKDRDAIVARFAEVDTDNSNFEIENRCLCADGSFRWIDWSCNLIPDQALLYVVGRDVTERRQAEQKFQGLLESAPDAMVIVDASGTIVLVNAQTEVLFGYRRAELVGQPIEVLVPTGLRENHPEKFQGFLNDPHPRPMGAEMDLHGQRKDGTEFPVEISLSPLRTDEGLLISSAIRDITQRRKAERKFQGLLESAPDAMVVVDESGTIVLVNTQAETLFGYAREKLVGEAIELLVPSRYREGHPQKFRSFANDPSPRPMGASMELFGQRQDGSEFPVEISLSPLQTDDGLLISSAIRDISQRRQSEKMFQDLLESAPDAMVVVDMSGTIVLVNAQTERLFGYQRKDLMGQPIETLVPSRLREGHPDKFKSFIHDPSPRPMGAGLKLFGQRQDGSEFPVEISLSPVQTEEGLLVSSAIRDVSSRTDA